MINDIIKKYHLNKDFIEHVGNVAHHAVIGGAISTATAGTTIALREGARYAGYASKGLKALTPTLALGASAIIDTCLAAAEYSETKVYLLFNNIIGWCWSCYQFNFSSSFNWNSCCCTSGCSFTCYTSGWSSLLDRS